MQNVYAVLYAINDANECLLFQLKKVNICNLGAQTQSKFAGGYL